MYLYSFKRTRNMQEKRFHCIYWKQYTSSAKLLQVQLEGWFWHWVTDHYGYNKYPGKGKSRIFIHTAARITTHRLQWLHLLPFVASRSFETERLYISVQAIEKIIYLFTDSRLLICCLKTLEVNILGKTLDATLTFLK